MDFYILGSVSTRSYFVSRNSVVSEHEVEAGSYRAYIWGFALSLIFTLISFSLVGRQMLSEAGLMISIAVLALLQFITQVFFFLHIGQETRPRWRQITFLFMIMVVATLVFGSLWIMSNLDYHHGMSPQQKENYILKDEGTEQ